MVSLLRNQLVTMEFGIESKGCTLQLVIWLVSAACTVWTWSNSGGRGKLRAIKLMSYDECGCKGRRALMGVGYVLLGRRGKGGERGTASGRKSKFFVEDS